MILIWESATYFGCCFFYQLRSLSHFHRENFWVLSGSIRTEPSSYIDSDKPPYSLNNIFHLISHSSLPLVSHTVWLTSVYQHTNTHTHIHTHTHTTHKHIHTHHTHTHTYTHTHHTHTHIHTHTQTHHTHTHTPHTYNHTHTPTHTHTHHTHTHTHTGWLLTSRT